MELDRRTAEVEVLRKRAEATTAKLGALASSGKVALNDDTVALMKELVQTLAEVNERLKRVEAEIVDLRNQVGEREKRAAKEGKDLADLRRFRNTSYFQFQYRDSDEPGRETAAFAFRRARVGTLVTLDERASFKVSFDFAAGGTSTAAQLRDGFLNYRVAPNLQAIVGQSPFPLGYDLERSSSQREFPERSRYNGTLFNGERGRGVYAKVGLGAGWTAQYGLWDALTATDPEQANLAPGPRGRLAHTVGLRHAGPNGEFGVSGLLGTRPRYTASGQTSPETPRRFLYLDGALLQGKFGVRAEAMFGADRVPNTVADPTAKGKNLNGWQLQASYDLSATHQVSARAEGFDPDTGQPGDAIEGLGLAYAYRIGERTKLTLAWERFRDPARGGSYRVITVRTQVRF
ncbi:MAG: hypothetical protein KIS66_08445 [Fimbriimonadaceae bacterium]|nr:hypothetical protein [Fimbriimonadaceae bacterium]